MFFPLTAPGITPMSILPAERGFSEYFLNYNNRQNWHQTLCVKPHFPVNSLLTHGWMSKKTHPWVRRVRQFFLNLPLIK